MSYLRKTEGAVIFALCPSQNSVMFNIWNIKTAPPVVLSVCLATIFSNVKCFFGLLLKKKIRGQSHIFIRSLNSYSFIYLFYLFIYLLNIFIYLSIYLFIISLSFRKEKKFLGKTTVKFDPKLTKQTPEDGEKHNDNKDENLRYLTLFWYLVNLEHISKPA